MTPIDGNTDFPTFLPGAPPPNFDLFTPPVITLSGAVDDQRTPGSTVSVPAAVSIVARAPIGTVS
ncbi:hypothetical protein GCM10018962_67790 [Dactylosporangium matsuzakiense]|uniref:Uncharacterized protein n=1 Tax=Dactylosporangium matsuzakiense TaxID=53360 RepID=A0A9W6NTA6_9ACTN|nr:hypothetical protein GCM10017581_103010 [Dactylosporangium matsuzakiense]